MNKIRKVMHEYKEGTLHSGSKKGPEVTSRKQAVAIAMSEAGKNKAKSKALEARSKKVGYYVRGHKNYGDVYEA